MLPNTASVLLGSRLVAALTQRLGLRRPIECLSEPRPDACVLSNTKLIVDVSSKERALVRW